jgi:hypothetical protein
VLNLKRIYIQGWIKWVHDINEMKLEESIFAVRVGIHADGIGTKP